MRMFAHVHKLPPRSLLWVEVFPSTGSEGSVWIAFCKTHCSWWRECARSGWKTGRGEVNRRDGWAATQPHCQQTGKICQQKPHEVQQQQQKKQMWSLVPGTEKPHESVELRGSSIKKFSKKGPVTPDRHEVKHGSAVHFCRNQGQLLSCTSQKQDSRELLFPSIQHVQNYTAPK